MCKQNAKCECERNSMPCLGKPGCKQPTQPPPQQPETDKSLIQLLEKLKRTSQMSNSVPYFQQPFTEQQIKTEDAKSSDSGVCETSQSNDDDKNQAANQKLETNNDVKLNNQYSPSTANQPPYFQLFNQTNQNLGIYNNDFSHIMSAPQQSSNFNGMNNCSMQFKTPILKPFPTNLPQTHIQPQTQNQPQLVHSQVPHQNMMHPNFPNMDMTTSMFHHMDQINQHQQQKSFHLMQLCRQTQQNSQQMHQQKQITQGVDNAYLDNVFSDIKLQMYYFFQCQNEALVDIKQKALLQNETIKELSIEVKKLQQQANVKLIKNQFPQTTKPQIIFSAIPQSVENIIPGAPLSPSNMIMFLFQQQQSEFQYKLELSQKLDLPLYRQRNFGINLALRDGQDKPVFNLNRISLTIAVYTSENPPQFIDSNTNGNQILKGCTEKDLAMGTASFEQIQIKEVTSHFRNGWVFLVIYPQVPLLEPSFPMNIPGSINYSEIKPLVIEKVIVKAKKIKDIKEDLTTGISQSVDDLNTCAKDETVQLKEI